MVVKVSKPKINVREKISELDKPSGIAGQAMLAAETPQEQFNLIGAGGNRNMIINGAMQVAQRGTTFDYNNNSGNIYTTCDRFALYKSTGTYNLTNTQSTDAPAGFSHSYKVVCDTAYTPSASDNFGINQNIETSSGLQRFGFGTSEAKDITFSFYVKGTPKTYTFQTNYIGTDGERKSQNKAFTVTNAWTRKVITLSAGGTSTSIGIGPGQTSTGMDFRVWLAAGPDDIASEITTWTANPTPTYESATGQGNFFSAVGNEFLITGIQLEVGNIATPFEHRSYGEELALCQRYAIVYGGAETRHLGTGSMYNAANVNFTIHTPVTMRAQPALIKTVNGSGTWLQVYVGATGNNSNPTPQLGEGGSTNIFRIYAPGTGLNQSVGSAAWVQVLAGASLELNAEL